jgi:mitochondrial fission protein ELM1
VRSTFLGLVLVLWGVALEARVVIVDTGLVGEHASLLAIAREVALESGEAIHVAKLAEFEAAEGDLVLHTLGQKKEVEKLLEIKGRLGDKIFLVNLYDPGLARESFDLILVPQYLPVPPTARQNFFKLTAVPSRINSRVLEAARQTPLYQQLPRAGGGRRLAVLLGGKTKYALMTPQQASRLGELVKALKEQDPDLKVAFSSSPRSPVQNAHAFLREFPDADFQYLWSKENSAANPYEAMLAWADQIVVTGDSMSMLSDALVTGKVTYFYAPQGSLELRHQQYILSLRDKLLPLGRELTARKYSPVNAAVEAAEQIKKMRACAGALVK